MKEQVLLKEIIEYLSYDKVLSNKDSFISKIKDNNKDFNEWEKVIYDYFDSHILEDGSIVSLETYYKENNNIDYEYYKHIDEEFVSELFKNNKPLYFLDVDNTLTDLGILSEEKKEFISSFKGKDRIILSTGKNYESITNVIDDCKLRDNYSSTINGSVIVYNGKYESISKLGSISKEIIDKLLKTDLSIITYYNDKIHLVKELTQENIDLLKRYNEYYLDNSKDTNYDNIVKILAFIYEGEDAKEQIVKDIVKDYPELISLRTSWHTYEILRRDQHKGNTVKEISKRLGHYYRCSIGVGDSMNDLQMLNYVGKPFIVSTSSKELKEYKFKELEDNRKIDIVNLIKEYK